MVKKLELKRLCIYIAVTFTISWIPVIIMNQFGLSWDGERVEFEQLAALCMLSPAIGHIITRWITKEGYAVTGEDSMKLGISFKDRRWIYFLFAMLVPWLYMEIANGLLLLIYPSAYDVDYIVAAGVDSRLRYLLPAVAIFNGTVVSFAAFGEEFGWRGYMIPKMIKLWGLPKAIIFGGIIWGVWHAPLTVKGHNFGTDYPGFPYVGIALMCIMCIFIGMMFTYITIKSGSIWPAAIMHAVNNAQPSILASFINADKLEELKPNIVVNWGIRILPIIVIGCICMVMMLKDKSIKSVDK